MKTLIFWAADFLREQIETPGGRLRAHAAYALAEFQLMMDTHGPFFSEEDSKKTAFYGRTFLLMYQQLASLYLKNQNPVSRRCYKIVPKFHSMVHLCENIVHSRRNPRRLTANMT